MAQMVHDASHQNSRAVTASRPMGMAMALMSSRSKRLGREEGLPYVHLDRALWIAAAQRAQGPRVSAGADPIPQVVEAEIAQPASGGGGLYAQIDTDSAAEAFLHGASGLLVEASGSRDCWGLPRECSRKG